MAITIATIGRLMKSFEIIDLFPLSDKLQFVVVATKTFVNETKGLFEATVLVAQSKSTN
jgi:hypothetical protein